MSRGKEIEMRKIQEFMKNTATIEGTMEDVIHSKIDPETLAELLEKFNGYATSTGIWNSGLGNQISNRLASYDRYRCDYCETWSGYGIGLCEKCGAPLPNKYVLTEP